MDSATNEKTVSQILDEEKAKLLAEIDEKIRKRKAKMEAEPQNELLRRYNKYT